MNTPKNDYRIQHSDLKLVIVQERPPSTTIFEVMRAAIRITNKRQNSVFVFVFKTAFTMYNSVIYPVPSFFFNSKAL